MLEHNPFMNLSWEVTASERVKCALLGPLLLPPRVLLLVGCVFAAYFWGRLSCIGGVDLNKPLPYWRIMVRPGGVGSVLSNDKVETPSQWTNTIHIHIINSCRSP